MSCVRVLKKACVGVMTFIRDDVREEVLSRYCFQNDKYYSLRNLSLYDEMISVCVRFGLRERRSSIPSEVILVSTFMRLTRRQTHYGMHVVTSAEMESMILGLKRHLGR